MSKGSISGEGGQHDRNIQIKELAKINDNVSLSKEGRKITEERIDKLSNQLDSALLKSEKLGKEVKLLRKEILRLKNTPPNNGL